MKNVWIRPYVLGGEDPKERSNFGLKIEFFHFFFLKFGLALRKVEASQGGRDRYSLSKLTTLRFA